MKYSNEWLVRREQKNVSGMPFTLWSKGMESRMRIGLWVDGVYGRHQLTFDDFPFEEVITIHFVEKVVVSGFSILLDGKELYNERFSMDYDLHEGASLSIDMKPLKMMTLPLILS